ncbi:MAG TPA: BatD family protein [Polyangia bacterium]|nr:BatD family protein [Polyangia bacterium]
MRRFRPAALAALSLAAMVAPAHAASFSASLDRDAVAPGEPFIYQVTLTVANEEVANFRPPDFHGLQVVQAPSFPSRSTSMQIAGGQTSVENSFSWTFQLAVPAGAKGTLTIGPAHARVGGRDMASNTVPVRVGAGSGAARPSRQPPAPGNIFQQFFGGGSGGPFGGGDADQSDALASSSSAAFIRVLPDKTRAFVGEQVTVGWYLYLTQNQNRYESITEPRTDGFWSEDIPSTNPQGRLSFTEQTLNGRTYNVALLFKKALFPLSAGKLTITPMEAEVSQVDLFGSAVRARRLKTDPLVIEAMPLPHAGQPAAFDPANVGKYQISATVDRAAVAVGDAVMLRVAVKGAGNVRNVRPPALPALEGWKSYEPKVDVAVDAGDSVTGTKTVEWLMRAERPGKTTVPPLALETFDPTAKRYQAERTSPIDLVVTGEASSAPPATAGTGNAAPPAEAAPGAIRPIHARPSLSTSPGLAFLRSGAFTATMVLPPLAWAAVLLFGRARARLSADEQRTRRRRLRSMARKRLRDAEAHRAAGRVTAFYAEIDRVLRDALGERLGTPVAGLQLGELRVLLGERGLGAAETAAVVSALETCDEARFAPGATAGNPAALAAMESRAADLVGAIDRAELRAEQHPEAKG